MKMSKGRLILLIAITLCWVAGMTLLFMSRVQAGVALWGISLMAGLIVYLLDRHRENLRQSEEALRQSGDEPEEKA